MYPMVSAAASTTLNGLKNVIMSCSQREKRRNYVLTERLRLCFPEERQTRQSCEDDQDNS